MTNEELVLAAKNLQYLRSLRNTLLNDRPLIINSEIEDELNSLAFDLWKEIVNLERCINKDLE
jgi:hypothetical protein